jgi:hypothetical protein
MSATAVRSMPRAKTDERARVKTTQSPERLTCDEAGSRLRGAASILRLGSEILGFVLRAGSGRDRTGTLGDTDRASADTRPLRACCPELANRGRLGLFTGWLAGTFVDAGCELSGAGKTSAPD